MKEVFEIFANSQLTGIQIEVLDELSDDISNQYEENIGIMGDLITTGDSKFMNDSIDSEKD